MGDKVGFVLGERERWEENGVQADMFKQFAPFHFDAVIAERGYDSAPLRKPLAVEQVELVIPSPRNRRQSRDFDGIRYRVPNIVERFINRVKWYRRIFTRYDKLARRFMAFLHFASTLIWLERDVNEA
jgi:transposase